MFSCIMKITTACLLLLAIPLFVSPRCSSTPGKQFYTAAVFEHARYDNQSESSEVIVETNLALYGKATEIAKVKGADIIVFPEYGIFSPGSRKHLKSFLESIPDPTLFSVNPCTEKDAHTQKQILYTLSCIARNNSIVVVANMGDIQNCEEDPECPPDGVFHFNTNVAFDRDGTLLVRYHKEHLYFESGMDLARKQQNSTFTLSSPTLNSTLTFATYICFDILYERMSRVAQWPGVDGIAFPTMWVDSRPQMTSVQLWQSWSLGNNATLLAANIQMPRSYAVGSGIFHGEAGALGYTFNTDKISKLVVSKVPKVYYPEFSSDASITAITATESWNFEDDGKDVPGICFPHTMDTSGSTTSYHCLSESTRNYTLVKLTKSSGHLEACNNGMCCSLDYSTHNLTDNFYLGAFNGSQWNGNEFNRYFWCDESCVLTTCDGSDDNPCALYPIRSETLFQRFRLIGRFSTRFVYPSVLESGVRLTPQSEWSYTLSPDIPYEAEIHYENHPGKKLITAGFKGRCYSRDPPYVR